MLRVALRRLSTTNARRSVDPVQAIFVNQIKAYAAAASATADGIVDADAQFQINRNDIQDRLARTYGGGDMSAFPDVTFTDVDLGQDAIDGERTIDIEVH